MKNRLIIVVSLFMVLIMVKGSFSFQKDVLAVLTDEKGINIEAQNYLSKEVILKKPVIIKGRVTDKGEEPIPSVKLYVSNLLDYNSIETVSDNDGYYRLEIPENTDATTYRLSIQFLPGEFEADSTKIFAEQDYSASRIRPSDSLCLNELIRARAKKTKRKEEKVIITINIAHQKESILTKNPEDAAKDVIKHRLNPSISIPIKERLIARFEEMRKIYPENLSYFEALGILQYELRNVAGRNYKNAAINRLRQTLKLNSTNMEVYHNLAELLADRGYHGEAIQAAVKALTIIGDDAETYEDREEFKWRIERERFNVKLAEKKKPLTKEEKKQRTEWSLKLIEDQREIYRKHGYPLQFKQYDLKEGKLEEWWYYTKGICFIFLNGMLNTKKEF